MQQKEKEGRKPNPHQNFTIFYGTNFNVNGVKKTNVFRESLSRKIVVILQGTVQFK